jgi:hypothetical protein
MARCAWSFPFPSYNNTHHQTMADGCTSAVQHLLRHLPNNLHGLWLEVNQLHDILKRGGFPLLPNSVTDLVTHDITNTASILQEQTFQNASRNSATLGLIFQTLLMGSSYKKVATSFLTKSNF